MTRRAGGQRTGALARLGTLAGALGFGALALGSAFDRANAEHGMSLPVPARFVGASAQHKVSAALATRDPAQIEDAARLMIDRQPLNASGPAVLGLAHMDVGDMAGADAALAVAGQLGWRSPITQEYWMKRALAAGDFRVAALRLDALLRQLPSLASKQDLLDTFETAPAARAALLDRMVQKPNWLGRYQDDVGSLSPKATLQRVAMLDALRQRGMVVGCEGARPLTETLVAQGAVVQASALWRSQCVNPGGAAALLWDGGLSDVNTNGAAKAFAWQVIGSGDVDVALAPEGVRISSSGVYELPVIRQLIVVPAGTYRLSWQAADSAGGQQPRIVARLTCSSAETRIAPVALAQDRWQADVTVDGACPAHWLQFMVRPGEGAVLLGKVALEPAAPR